MNVLNGESFVGGFQRPAVLKNDHSAHNGIRTDIGDVVGFNPGRGLFKTQQLGQLVESGQLPPGAALAPQRKLLGGIEPRHFHQLEGISPLRDQNRHPAARPLGKQPLDQLPVGQLAVEQNLAGQLVQRIGVVPRKELPAHLLDRVSLRKEKVELIDQLLFPELQNAQREVGPRLDKGQHILIDRPGVNHSLALGKAFDRPQTVAAAGRPLKFEGFGGGFHLPGEHLHCIGASALDIIDGLPHRLTVLRRGYLAPADPHALLHVEIQAGTPFSKIPGELPGAGRQQKGLVRFVNGIFDHPRRHIRPDILGSVVCLLLDLGDPGVGVAAADPQIAVALVILQQDVVLWVVQLDQAAFEHQRLKFARGHNGLKVLHLHHHRQHLGGMPLQRAEIARHPVLQLFGLADVDDLPRPVVHEVNSRLAGQRPCFFVQPFNRRTAFFRHRIPSR